MVFESGDGTFISTTSIIDGVPGPVVVDQYAGGWTVYKNSEAAFVFGPDGEIYYSTLDGGPLIPFDPNDEYQQKQFEQIVDAADEYYSPDNWPCPEHAPDRILDAVADAGSAAVLPHGNSTTTIADAFNAAIRFASPLVLDLDDDGIELTDLKDSETQFDIDNDGIAERVGWVLEPGGGGGDGFLVRDLDGDGLISSQSELFGNSSSNDPDKDHGFIPLIALDTNGNGTVAGTELDGIQVWVDANGNGITDSGELLSLQEAGVSSFDVSNIIEETDTYIEENWISHVSTYTTTTGNEHQIVDVWFRTDQLNSEQVTLPNEDGSQPVIPQDVLELPGLEGYGDLPDLHVSMITDASLKTKLQAINSWSLTDLGNANVLQETADILHDWAGTDTVAAGSRGSTVDAAALEFFEELMGEDWERSLGGSDPLGDAGKVLNNAWDEALPGFATRLILQTDLAEHLPGLVYVPSADQIWGELDFDEIMANLPTDAGEERGLFAVVKLATLAIITERNLEDDHYQTELDALYQSGSADATVTEALALGSAGTWTSGDDEINDNDAINVLFGGAGNDQLNGGGGDDRYVFQLGDGQDTIYDTGGYDRITFGDSITAADLSFSASTTSGISAGLNIQIGTGSDSIDIDYQYQYGFLLVEELEFADGTTLDLRDIFVTRTGDATSENLGGSANKDIIDGDAGDDTIDANGDDDIIYGGDGNDRIDGDWGDDTIFGGAGNDFLRGISGDDRYVYQSGDDTISDNGGGHDTLVFGGTLTLADIDILNLAGSVQITVLNTGDVISLDNQVNHPTNSFVIEELEFSNGEVYGLVNEEIRQIGTAGDDNLSGNGDIDGLAGDDTIEGGSTADYIKGGAGNDRISADISGTGQAADTLDGGDGDDFLRGRGDDDTYLVSLGHDTILDDHGGGIDVVQFGFGISFEDLEFNRLHGGPESGLLITWGDENSSLLLQEQFDTQNGGQIETLKFYDGSSVAVADVDYVLTATEGDDVFGTSLVLRLNNDIVNLLGGDDNFQTWTQSSKVDVRGGDGNDTIQGARSGASNDTLDGGNGDDLLRGNGGDDRYIASSGNDTVNEKTAGSGNDTIEFGPGISSTSVRFYEQGDDLLIDWGVPNSSIVLLGQLNSNANDKVEWAEFADGSTLDLINDISITPLGSSGADSFVGGSGNDLYDGGSGDDTLEGLTGNDTLYGGYGNDLIQGGADADALYGGYAADTLNGGAGADTLYGGSWSDEFAGTAAELDGDLIADFQITDVIRVIGGSALQLADLSMTPGTSETVLSIDGQGLLADISITGDFAIDTVTADGTDALITLKYPVISTWDGTSGADTFTATPPEYWVIDGGDGDDSLTGGTGHDTLNGGAGDDTLVGGAGDDVFIITDAPDTIQGGNGIDVVDASDLTEAARIYLWQGIAIGASGFGDISGVEVAIGSDFADKLAGHNSFHETIYGGDGDDTFFLNRDAGDYLYGQGGSDWIEANDTFQGVDIDLEAGLGFYESDTLLADTIVGIENVDATDSDDRIVGNANTNIIYGNGGDDLIIWSGADDVIDGGAGIDTIDASAATGGVTLFLWDSNPNANPPGSFTSVEVAIGSDQDDRLGGVGGYADTLLGGAGADTFYMDRADTDYRDGGAGEDWIFAQDINDLNDDSIGLVFDLHYGNATDEAGNIDTMLRFEHIQATEFADNITGSIDANILYGNGGDDTIWSGNGADTVDGGDGNDTINGGGADDILMGGNGGDAFLFDSTKVQGDDVIEDFVIGTDTISVIGETAADLVASAANDINGDAVITHGGGTITLLGIDETAVVTSMFS
ncbi:MAG: hypothetical protein KI792_06690 [Alphaproteobacteria bacterium]|nr:hypothetical protein [Alphaproteobacteria bacterium SS10]